MNAAHCLPVSVVFPVTGVSHLFQAPVPGLFRPRVQRLLVDAKLPASQVVATGMQLHFLRHLGRSLPEPDFNAGGLSGGDLRPDFRGDQNGSRRQAWKFGRYFPVEHGS